MLTLAADLEMLAYIPERTSPKQRRWKNDDPANVPPETPKDAR